MGVPATHSPRCPKCLGQHVAALLFVPIWPCEEPPDLYAINEANPPSEMGLGATICLCCGWGSTCHGQVFDAAPVPEALGANHAAAVPTA